MVGEVGFVASSVLRPGFDLIKSVYFFILKCAISHSVVCRVAVV